MGVKILADRPDDFKIFFSTPTRMVPTHSECVHHPPPLSTAITRSYRLHPVPWCWMLVAISYMPSSMPGPFAAVVMIGKGLYGRVGPRMDQAYQSLPTRPTKPKTKWSCMWNTLPNPTKIGAHRAKLIGGFGLVYQRLPVSGSGPPTVMG